MEIDKAAQKRFRLVCPKELIAAYIWWRVNLIGYSHYRGAMPPKFPKSIRTAWMKHARNLIKKYARRRKLDCGHVSRDIHCKKCIGIAIKSFEQIKRRGQWASEKR